MEPYRTTFTIPASDFPVTYKTPTVFIGSCFTENIGQRLLELKFPVDINPFGVIYNPCSVKNSLEILIRKKEFSEKDLIFFDNQWVSFYHQTSFSDPDLKQCLKGINKRINYSSDLLKKADFLFITFGTARVFEWKDTGQVVSNCHKIPADKFTRRLLTPKEITGIFTSLIDELRIFNSRLRIVFTVSPVRHWKDGATGNQISKATLLLAIRNLNEHFPDTSYFPAYELMMDDLRDYRYYAEDMIHLNKTAIDYIWEKFGNSFFDKETTANTMEVNKILQAYNHRPMKSDSESHIKFLEKNLELVKQLHDKYPFLDLKKELDYFAGK